MLPHQHRLTGRVVKFVAKRGRGVSGPTLRIKWTPARYPPSRATVVAGLAVDKRATKRNLVKRKVREALRPLLLRFPAPVSLVVFVNKGALRRTFQQLRAELFELCQRARLL